MTAAVDLMDHEDGQGQHKTVIYLRGRIQDILFIVRARIFFRTPFKLLAPTLHPLRTLARTHGIDSKFCVYADFLH